MEYLFSETEGFLWYPNKQMQRRLGHFKWGNNIVASLQGDFDMGFGFYVYDIHFRYRFTILFPLWLYFAYFWKGYCDFGILLPYVPLCVGYI